MLDLPGTRAARRRWWRHRHGPAGSTTGVVNMARRGPVTSPG
ncbi:MAG: hypothetical protein ACYC19_00205 [Acidimicrobiales bacterium]